VSVPSIYAERWPEIGIDRRLELFAARKKRLLQLQKIGASLRSRRRALAQKSLALPGEDRHQTDLIRSLGHAHSWQALSCWTAGHCRTSPLDALAKFGCISSSFVSGRERAAGVLACSGGASPFSKNARSASVSNRKIEFVNSQLLFDSGIHQS